MREVERQIMLREWEKLPKYMRTEAVRPYYERLRKKKISLYLKRGFDFITAMLLLLVLIPAMIVIAVLIVLDSRGGFLYCQERITQYGRKFKIFKFRTMAVDADKVGSQVTVQNDCRITKIGVTLRKYRLDELPQLINIILGDMSFCGTRPESPYYVKKYTPEMFATLLLPAGVTSEASIHYKDEAELLGTAQNVDEIYVKEILPQKMKYNLEEIKKFSCFREIRTILKTLIVILGH